MAIAYKCDICGVYIDNASPSMVEQQKDVTIKGIPINIAINIVVDPFEKPKPHHVCSQCWETILLKIATYIQNKYS